MYQNKLAVALKAGGKILREFKDTVYVPFGTEYSILIKNLNTVRASVQISVDGQDATEDVSLVIEPNSEFELTRFIKNGNLSTGNRFKFIERTAGIEQHRGIKLDDGLIRIAFQWELKIPKNNWTQQQYISDRFHSGDRQYYKGLVGSTCHERPTLSRTGLNDQSFVNSSEVRGIQCSTANINQMSYSASVASAQNPGFLGTAQAMSAVSDVGITVPGAVSNQQFRTTSAFLTDGEDHVMVLKLAGELGQGIPVTQPVTVKTKPVCSSCGKVNKATAKFCSECGTGLQIV